MGLLRLHQICLETGYECCGPAGLTYWITNLILVRLPLSRVASRIYTGPYKYERPLGKVDTFPLYLMVSSSIETLLDAFLHTARSSASIEDLVLECGSEHWTYGDLDSISSGLALELHQQYGLQPTVAVLSENHPYIFALLLAIWKLGGIFAPLDHNSPPDMIKQMAENIRPTCVLIPEDMDAARETFSGNHRFF